MTDDTRTEAVAIKPCPWCASTDIVKVDNGHTEYLRCNGCNALGPWIEPPPGHKYTGTELEDQWNTRTAIAAMPVDPRIEQGREALGVFAACCEQIAPDESDEEWAKFRLLVRDYRKARTVYQAMGGGE